MISILLGTRWYLISMSTVMVHDLILSTKLLSHKCTYVI
jgi:hypothetical protein